MSDNEIPCVVVEVDDNKLGGWRVRPFGSEGIKKEDLPIASKSMQYSTPSHNGIGQNLVLREGQHVMCKRNPDGKFEITGFINRTASNKNKSTDPENYDGVDYNESDVSVIGPNEYLNPAVHNKEAGGTPLERQHIYVTDKNGKVTKVSQQPIQRHVNNGNPSPNAHPYPKETANQNYNRKNKFANKKTYTGAKQNIKNILAGLNEVDPQRTSNIFPQFYDMMEKINSATYFKGGSGSSTSANEGQSGDEPTQELQELITDALTGALSRLVKELGYGPVLVSFTLPLLTNFDDLLESYKNMVKDALISLYISVLLYGEKDLPVCVIPEIVFGDNIPPNVVVNYSDIPDFYTQVYYTKDNDPYPGYVEFEGPEDGDSSYYLLRTDEYRPFDSLEQEVYSDAEIGLSTDLRPYIVSVSLTVEILNTLLEKYCNQVSDKTEEKAIGKGSGSSTDLISMLGPVLGGAINKAQSNHLPNSFLDQSKMNKLLKSTIKEQNELKNVIEKFSYKAIKMPNKSSSMSSTIASTNLTSNEVAEAFMTHVSRMTDDVSSDVPENFDLEDFKQKADLLSTAADDLDIKKLLDFVKEI